MDNCMIDLAIYLNPSWVNRFLRGSIPLIACKRLLGMFHLSQKTDELG